MLAVNSYNCSKYPLCVLWKYLIAIFNLVLEQNLKLLFVLFSKKKNQKTVWSGGGMTFSVE